MVEETKVDDAFIAEMDKYRQPDKSKKLIQNCADNIVIFAKYMLGIDLYSWQIKFLTSVQESIDNKENPDITHEFAAMTSRQVGKSTALSVLALWVAIFNKLPHGIGNNTAVGITSASDQQARTLLREMRKMYRLGDRYMEEKYRDDDDQPLFKKFFTSLIDEKSANNSTNISLKPYNEKVHGLLLKGSRAGSYIVSNPPTPVVLGSTFSMVLIDEAGKRERITDEFFYEVIRPTGTATDAIFVYTSTPWVSSGFFYEKVTNSDNVNTLVFTIDAIAKEAPKQYTSVKRDFIEPMNKEGKTDEVQRAFYCRFVKGEQSYFDPDDVRDMFDDTLHPIDGYLGLCDMGVDFGGKVNSKTVITITALQEDGKIRRLYHKSYEVNKDDNLLDDIAALMGRFNIQRIIPDDCLDEDTRVLMGDRTVKCIKDIRVNDYVLSYNPQTETFEPKRVTKVIDKGMLPTKKIEFRNGATVYATDSHEWFYKTQQTDKPRVCKTGFLANHRCMIPVYKEEGSDVDIDNTVVHQHNGSLSHGHVRTRSITDGGVRHVYDIKVEDNESFVLADGGIVTHNCPAGIYLIREMIEQRGWDVHPMNFRSEKVKKYGAFRGTLRRGLIESYPDTDLQTEMLALEYSHGRRNSVIEHAPGYSDDLIDSFVMSSYFFVFEEGGVKTFSWYEDEE